MERTVDANEQTAGMVEACLYGSSILDIPTHELAMKPEILFRQARPALPPPREAPLGHVRQQPHNLVFVWRYELDDRRAHLGWQVANCFIKNIAEQATFFWWKNAIYHHNLCTRVGN